MKLSVNILLGSLNICLLVLLSCKPNNESSLEVLDPKVSTTNTTKFDKVVFSVIGDVPYTAGQRDGLMAMIQTHNAKAKSEFVVHVGDIKAGKDPCDESVYKDVSGLLTEFTTPTFMLLGDNEYNDCKDPNAALLLWNQYFLNFHKKWAFEQEVIYQSDRLENFGWVQDKIIFMGLNLVGSTIHDQDEWDKRLADNADFLEQLVNDNKDSAKALVVFGHANMVNGKPAYFKTFTDVFRSVAKDFQKPIVYIQGDGHRWIQDRPYDEQNILRVQIEGSVSAVQVTVDPNLEQPFSFEREFLDQ